MKTQKCIGVIVFTIFLSTICFAEHCEDGDIGCMISQIEPTNLQKSIESLVSFYTRNTYSEQNNPTHGIGASIEWIFNEFNQIASNSPGEMSVKKQTFLQNPSTQFNITQAVVITNVIATLVGTKNPERIFILGAHFDSRCSLGNDPKCEAPGADDDASGVAALLEVARIFSQQQFDSTIMFITFDGEEQGLIGSAYYADLAKKNNLNIEGMLQDDIVGASLGENGILDKNHVRVFSEGAPKYETSEESVQRYALGSENDSPSRQLARYIYETTEKYISEFHVKLIFRVDRLGRSSDDVSFLSERYAAVRFTETNEDYRHQHQNVRIEDGQQYGDLTTFLDYEYMAHVAQVNAAALASLALAPGKPQNLIILSPSPPVVYTQLLWQMNNETDLAGYEVVWRDTTASLWTDYQFVGKVTSYTTQLSKDNYFFGVRAVDVDGYRSIISFPRLGR